RILHVHVPVVCAIPAHDSHERSSHVAALGQGQGQDGTGGCSIMPAREGTYGLLAEFDTPGDLVRAARQAYHDGWRRLDCYSPIPVEEAAEAIGFHRNKVPLLCLIGGLMG